MYDVIWPSSFRTRWVSCDRCGCSIELVLVDPDGHHFSEDGDFYCADCWEKIDTEGCGQ